MLKLEAKIRKSKKADDTRKEGRLPAVVYGYGVDNRVIDVDYQEMKKILSAGGESTLIELNVEGDKPVTVLAHEIQYNPVTDDISHVDFYQIKEGEKLTVGIEFVFIGEAPAVKELGGILVKSHSKVEVRCLPKDLIDNIEVDLSVLKTFEDSIYVSQLNIPETLEIIDADIVVASITQPRKEEPKEEVEEPADGENKEGDAPANTEEKKSE